MRLFKVEKTNANAKDEMFMNSLRKLVKLRRGLLELVVQKVTPYDVA